MPISFKNISNCLLLFTTITTIFQVTIIFHLDTSNCLCFSVCILYNFYPVNFIKHKKLHNLYPFYTKCFNNFPLGFPGGLLIRNLPAKAGEAGSISGLGRSPGVGKDNLLQYSCLENSMNREAWQAIVHEAAKSWTRLREWTHTHNNKHTFHYI